MSNTLTIQGLRPVGTVNGSPYSSSVQHMVHDSGDGVAIFIGDLVTQTGGSTIKADGTVLPNVVQSATGDVFSGVCVGVLPDTRDSLIYCAASTTRTLLIETNPDALYEATDVGTGTPLNANDIGLNCNVVVGTGSTTTGMSAMALNNVGEANTNTLDLRIIGMVNRVDNDPGSAAGTGAAGAKFLVRINRHRYANQVAGI